MNKGCHLLEGSAQAERASLLRLIASKCYQRRKVVLSSGSISDYYLDCRRASLDPTGALLCGRVLFALYCELGIEVEAVGGPTLGADPLVVSFILTALQHGKYLPGFLVRKSPKAHGTGSMIEGLANIRPGARVLLLEDVLTTGRSLANAAQATKEAGLSPALAMVLVDREEGGAEALLSIGLPCVAVFTAREVANLHDVVNIGTGGPSCEPNQ